VTGGTVDVQTGTLGLQGGGTETGASFSIETGATLDFAGSTAFSLDSGTTFSGAGNLTKDGPTTLTLPGTSASLTGPTTVNSGTLLVNGSQPGSAVSVDSGSTLGGNGTVGAVATTGGTVSPGDGPGILNVHGNVTLDPSSTFAVALDGPTPGTGYDQLNVTGTVNLAGSTLSPSVGFKPSGESFTIIRSTGPIVGTFKGLRQGALLVIDKLPFTISYAGGNGDDVVLTVVGPVLPPRILSKDSTTFTVGAAGAFTVSAIGGPLPALSETGALPSGVTFVENGAGYPALAGTPKAGTGGTYHLTITASNGQVPSATQNFTLTVDEAPVITSAASTTFMAGQAGSFLVRATGSPTAAISETGALPPGVTFVNNGDGTATLTAAPAANLAGTFQLRITAANGVGTAATQDFTFHVVIATPPKVLRLQRLRGRTPTRIVLSFDQPMNPALAQVTSNYVFRRVVRGRALGGPRRAIRVTSAVYDPAKQTVTLTTARRLSLKQVYQITVNGGAPRGLTNVSGVPLDVKGNGLSGSVFIMSFTGWASLG